MADTQDPRAIWDSLTPRARALLDVGALPGARTPIADDQAFADLCRARLITSDNGASDWHLTDLGRAVRLAGQEVICG